MLLFIEWSDIYNQKPIGFNTSHVTLYLMEEIADVLICMFQYITCYSLSTSWDLTQSSYYRFNTSHVTLYQ